MQAETESFKKGINLGILYTLGINMAYSGNVRSLETVKREDLVRVCSECGSKDIEYANEEFYCKKCGLVLD